MRRSLLTFQGKMTQLKIFVAAIMVITGLVAATTYAQSTTLDNVTITYTEAANDDGGAVIVSAYVSVFDEVGQPVQGLDAANFAVLENGRPVDRPFSLDVAQDALTIILVIDTSGSMAAQGSDNVTAIEAAKQAAITFIDTLAPNDQIAVYSFSNAVTLQQALTLDHNLAVNEGILPLTYTDFGETCLYDALLTAINTSATVPLGRRAILVLTDGADSTANGSCAGTTLAEVTVEARANRLKVPIFPIGFGEVDAAELDELARSTGGRSLISADASALETQFQALATQFRQQYHLQYPTNAASGEHELSVVVTIDGRREQDRRRVFVPARVMPTPTPVPQFTIGITATETSNGIEITLLDLPPDDSLTVSELFVDDMLTQRYRTAPFNVFTLDKTTIGTGTHRIRAEVTNIDAVTAIAGIEITVIIPPTPTPPPPATAIAPVAESSPPAPDTGTALLNSLGTVLIFILLGGILLLIGGGLLLYGIMGGFTRRPRAETTAAVPIASPPDTFDEHPTETPIPGYNAMLEDDNAPTLRVAKASAQLVVVEGQLGQPQYTIDQPKTLIGRNARDVVNHINIQDKSVSRRHAEILWSGHKYSIRDVGSSSGTRVNGKPIAPHQEIGLTAGVVVSIGPYIKFRFDVTVPNLDPDATSIFEG